VAADALLVIAGELVIQNGGVETSEVSSRNLKKPKDGTQALRGVKMDSESGSVQEECQAGARIAS
jgi:hypothetical protein